MDATATVRTHTCFGPINEARDGTCTAQIPLEKRWCPEHEPTTCSHPECENPPWIAEGRYQCRTHVEAFERGVRWDVIKWTAAIVIGLIAVFGAAIWYDSGHPVEPPDGPSEPYCEWTHYGYTCS